MNSIRRIRSVLVSLIMLLASGLILVSPKDGYYIVVLILDITFLLYGIRMLIYYLTMARFMVGGIMTLYKSIIAIDFGLFIFSIDDVPIRFVMMYLVGLMIFNGAIVLLGAMDAKRIHASFWKNRMLYGMVMLLLGIASICLWDSEQMVSILYAISLIHSAV